MRSLRQSLAAHLRIPLYRNGYSLILSSGVTSLLGMVFWLLVARSYRPEVVGVNAAAISAMVLCATIAQFNLTSALNRFIPTAGSRAARLIVRSYTASGGAAVVVTTIFLAGVPVWAPQLSFLRATPGMSLWFVTATVLWCVFVLQDGALTGMRQAVWVPVENAAFAVTKLGLLLALAAAASLYGLFLAWTLPLVFVVAAVNWLIFRRLLPRHRSVVEAPLASRELRCFVAGDYTASLLGTGLHNLLPILAVQLAGPAAGAYFSLAATIEYSLTLVSRNLGTALVAEAARDEARLGEYIYRAARQAVRILIPTVGFMLFAAPYILRLFGAEYAAGGTTLLRLLLLASLPTIVTSVYISMLRVQRRMRALVMTTLALALLVLPASVVLLRHIGILGIGLAWLGAHSVVAAVLLATELRSIWLAHLPQWLCRGLARVAMSVSPGSRRAAAQVVPLLIDAGLPAEWRIQRVLPTTGRGVVVAALGAPQQPTSAFLKLSRAEQMDLTVHSEVRALQTLADDPRLTSWQYLVPELLSFGRSDGRPFAALAALPGTPGTQLLRDESSRAHIFAAARTVIAHLHDLTSVETVVDDVLLASWIDEPLASLAVFGSQRTIASLGVELHEALAGRTLRVGWMHGDYTLGNILFDHDGQVVTGIIDWERSSPQGVVALDECYLQLSTAVIAARRELGDLVCGVLAGDRRDMRFADEHEVSSRTLVLLSWLRHVAGSYERFPKSRGPGSVWAARNVEAVLTRMAPIHCPVLRHTG